MVSFVGYKHGTPISEQVSHNINSYYSLANWANTKWKQGPNNYPDLILNGYFLFDGIILSNGRITQTQAKLQATYADVGWEFGRTWAILENNSYPFLLKHGAIDNGIPLTSQKINVFVVEDVEGSMLFNGRVYKYVRAIYRSDIVTGVEGSVKTWTYDGDEITDDYGTVYTFLASGVQDPSYPGNYGSYSTLTERSVAFLANRSNNVNFYYIAKPSEESIKATLSGVSSAEIAKILLQKHIKQPLFGRSKFLIGAKKIVKKPIQINVVLEPGAELIIDSNLMIAIKNNNQNVSKQLNGPYPILNSGETIVSYTDDEASRNVSITIETKGRWR